MSNALQAASAVILLHASAFWADDPARPLPQTPIPNVTFADQDRSIALHDFKDKKFLIIVFLSFDCPISNSYAKPLTELFDKYSKQDVAFLGMTVNPDETQKQVADHARSFKIPFPVLRDDGFAATRALKASITPEAFILDSGLVMRYRGRIDNGYYSRLENQKVTERNLEQALQELLAGKAVSVPVTEAVGCTIPMPVEEAAASSSLTYYRDVLPVLQRHCQRCHASGQAGPFALTTYRQAVNWANDIKKYTQERLMPPGQPLAGGPFQGAASMTREEIATLAAWADGGTPAGELVDSPPPAEQTAHWALGPPDLILQPLEPFLLGPTGGDHIRFFALPTKLLQDRFVTAIDVQPGNRAIVRRALLFIAAATPAPGMQHRSGTTDRHVNKAVGDDAGAGYPASAASGASLRPIGDWYPGKAIRASTEAGYLLPKAADLVLQVHYRRTGKVEQDQTQVGLYFAKDESAPLKQGRLRLANGNQPLYAVAEAIASADFQLHAMVPSLGSAQEIKVTALAPHEKEITLLHVRDRHWVAMYSFQQPLPIRAGTRIQVQMPAGPDRAGQDDTSAMKAVDFIGTSAAGLELPLWPSPADVAGELRERVERLEGALSQLRAELVELRNSAKPSLLDRTVQSPPRTGRVLLLNLFREKLVFRINNQEYAVAAGAARLIDGVRAGPVDYEIVSASWRKDRVRTTLSADEVLTLTAR